ncbi:MAG TPA: HYR domain-containing protein [Verrucomicrobiae bacterium]|nr:HYR domain-containing protein [Verrucomicrobiae bacterium]
MSSCRTISIFKTILIATAILFAFGLAGAFGQATVTTDKMDYHPGDTVIITGSGWQAGETVLLEIVESPFIHPAETLFAVASGSGDIYNNQYIIQLHDLGQTFTLTAIGQSSGMTASTMFTDAPPAANLDQYRNGSADAPITTGGNWVNGNAGAENSHYVEGMSIPYRCRMTDLPTGTTIALTLGYDVKHSDAHALDYLTHFNRLEPHTFATHTTPEPLNPLAGVTGVSATVSTFTIPAPSSAGSPVPGQPTTSYNNLPAGERLMTLYGGTIDSIKYATQGSLTASQSETQITVYFRADGLTAVLSWGGHIGSRLDWGYEPDGTPRSAGGISGSPYHMRLIDWNLNNLGNQDRSLKADAVAPPCDIVGPSPVCGGSTNQYCAPGGTGVTYSWSITGNGTIVGSTTGQCINVQADASGSYTVTVTATQSNGPSSTCTKTVTISPLPICSIDGADSVCPQSSNNHCGPAGAASYEWSISGNGTISSSTTSQCVSVLAGSSCNAPYTLTLKIKNADQCSSLCSKTVQVVDTTKPTISCPGPVTVECLADVPPVNIGSVTASDNCSGVTVTHDGDVASGSCPKIITRTYRATDACGNFATCTQTITVDDNTPPVLAGCPQNASLQCYADVPAPAVVTATDNCDGVIQVQFNETQSNPGSSCNNIITRTWTATDACGNVATCQQVITVNDNTAPIVTCPANIDVNNDPATCDAVVNFTATATDNCAPTPSVVCVPPSGTAFPVGVTTVTCTATDDCGNSSSCSFTVTVRDNERPVLVNCPDPGPLTVECGVQLVPPPDPTPQDNCDPNPIIAFRQDSIPGNCPQEYTLINTWIITDASGNSDSCKQTIIVQDTQAPTISGVDAGYRVECPAVPVFSNPSAADLCDPNPGLTFVDVTTPGNCPQEYSVTRTWTAVDACGNSATASQTINVQDVTAPVLTACPDNIAVCAGAPISFNPPTATDNCDGDVPVTCTRSDGQGLGAPYPVGTTTITCVATDDCGNSDDCSFMVTVYETPACSINEGPGFGTPVCAGSGVPLVSLFCGPDGMASYSWSVDCGTIDGSSTSQCVSWIPPAVGGTCTFTLTIVDGNGCISTCTRSISVPNPTPCVLAPPSTLPVCGSSGNIYCGPAGFANYNWTISSPGNDWVITGGQGTSCITYTAGLSGPVTILLDATNNFGCHSSCDISFNCTPQFEGCTPGFWKNHTRLWDQAGDPVSQCVAASIASLGSPYGGSATTASLFRMTFGLTQSQMSAVGLNPNLSLQQAINLGGGGYQKLARHGVAAVLSSCAVNYTYSTTQVLTMVQNAIVDRQPEPTAQQLASANELTHINCPGGPQPASLAALLAQAGEFMRGDLNGDGSFTPVDVVTLLNIVFGGMQPTQSVCAADLNRDGLFSPSDVVAGLSCIFGGSGEVCGELCVDASGETEELPMDSNPVVSPKK